MAENVKEDVIHILQQMINGKKNIIHGCAELDRYLMEGHDFIYWEFDEYYYELLQYPLPEQYHLWETRALEDKLKEIDRTYREKVIDLAKDLLEELTNQGS